MCLRDAGCTTAAARSPCRPDPADWHGGRGRDRVANGVVQEPRARVCDCASRQVPRWRYHDPPPRWQPLQRSRAEGISITLEGQPVLSAKSIGLRYNLYQLITSNLTIDELRVNEPAVRLEPDGEGWTIARLIKKQESEANRQGPLAPIRIDDIGISNGSILVASGVGIPGVQIPKRVERIDAKLSFAYEPVHYSIESITSRSEPVSQNSP